MIPRPLSAALLSLVIGACGMEAEQKAADPVTPQEQQALEDAASMLDETDIPASDAPEGEVPPDNQTPGETP